MDMIDIAVIGGGTAGLTAAIYGTRAGKSVRVFEQSFCGGQIVYAQEIENYPGFKNISGFEFASALQAQATQLGTVIETDRVNEIRDYGAYKGIITAKGEIRARTVILAVGAKNRPLGLEQEAELVGRGVSYCATCDGAFFKGKTVAVAGGGNTALDDALFLSAYCETVYLIHRRDTFRSEAAKEQLVRSKENVVLLLDTVVTGLKWEDRLTGIEYENKKTGEESELALSGLFVAIGQIPDTGAFGDIVALDSAGYVIAGEDCRTKTRGIFAAGDCRTKTVRQLTTAAADGTVAALAACEYLEMQVE